MDISQAGLDAIKGYEGVKLNAYLDSGGVPTIGVGHTVGVKMGDTITMSQCDELLRQDVQKAVMNVIRLVHVKLSQGQFDALVSFVFNLGAGAFAGSTLLRSLNNGNYSAAADEFPKWNHDNGHVVDGLTKRRAAERTMFLGA